MTETAAAVVTTVRVHGLHCWPDAPEHVNYLRHPHRHEFRFVVVVRVMHDDRDVEFHTLQQLTRETLERLWRPSYSAKGFDFGTLSCEALATQLGNELRECNVNVEIVNVWEDEDNGASVAFPGLPMKETDA